MVKKKNTNMLVHHSEALERSFNPSFVYPHTDIVLTPVETLNDDGIVVQSIENRLLDYSKLNEGFKPSDFALRNVIAVGAQSSLTEMRVSCDGQFDTISETINGLLDDLDDPYEPVEPVKPVEPVVNS